MASASDKRIAAGPSGKKNSASMRSNGVSRWSCCNNGRVARKIAAGLRAPPNTGMAVNGGRNTSSPRQLSSRKAFRSDWSANRLSGHGAVPTGLTTVTAKSRISDKARVCLSTKIPKFGLWTAGNKVERVSMRKIEPYNLRTSRTAFAIHAGSVTTCCRAPPSSGSKCNLPASRPSKRPKMNRPPGRGTKTSRLSAEAKSSG